MSVKRIFTILAGNFIEFYDFTLFAYLLPIIAPILFKKNDVQSLTVGYVFLVIAFFARPIGAIGFGYIGDKYGRRLSMIIAISMISISTLMISILPLTGKYTIILLVFSRILQGISAGGEYSGAGLLLVENNTKNKQFLSGAILTTSALLGAFFASFTSAVISISLFPEYSWRILFLFGGIIGLVVLRLRLNYADNLHIKTNRENCNWKLLFNKHKLSLLCVIIFGGLMNVPFQMVTGFVNTYFIATGEYAKTSLMFINSFVILSYHP